MKAEAGRRSGVARSIEAGAAVAIITSAAPEESVLLLRRNHHSLDPWSGHYAFPGGRREIADETLLDTCLREVREETGIELAAAALRETLKPRLAGRNIKAPLLVQPYRFEIPQRLPVTVEEAEIISYTWLSTAAFRDERRHRLVEVRPAVRRPVFPLDDYYVWGFTYRLLCRTVGFDHSLVTAGTD